MPMRSDGVPGTASVRFASDMFLTMVMTFLTVEVYKQAQTFARNSLDRPGRAHLRFL